MNTKQHQVRWNLHVGIERYMHHQRSLIFFANADVFYMVYMIHQCVVMALQVGNFANASLFKTLDVWFREQHIVGFSDADADTYACSTYRYHLNTSKLFYA